VQPTGIYNEEEKVRQHTEAVFEEECQKVAPSLQSGLARTGSQQKRHDQTDSMPQRPREPHFSRLFVEFPLSCPIVLGQQARNRHTEEDAILIVDG